MIFVFLKLLKLFNVFYLVCVDECVDLASCGLRCISGSVIGRL